MTKDLYQTTYNRQDCSVGVVHIGFGAFHRAHQAIYLDDVMQETGDLRWGIAAVNLRQSESESFNAAAQMNGGYVIKSIAPDGENFYRLVRSHLEFIDATKTPQDAYDLLVRESVQMVTVTVTETGYYLNNDWALDLDAAPIAAGLAGEDAETIYDYLAKALKQRFNTTKAPLSILCCDNMRNNGNVLRNALLAYLAAMGEDELIDWVKTHVSFPCSMVDRITPRSTPALGDEIKAIYPEHALAPIHAETFMQWVIQDHFVGDRPDWQKVGVQVVADVEPFEEAKIRILNGGHTGLAYLGALAGHQTFDQAKRDPELGMHFDRWEETEVLPGLGEHIPFDTSVYLAEISERFENQGIADHLERICMDGYTKMAIYVKPTLEACLQKGIVPEAGFDSVASWIIYARKCTDGQCQIPYHEPFWDVMAPKIKPGHEEEIASDPHIWGDLPERFENFVPGLVAAIQRMEQKWQA